MSLLNHALHAAHGRPLPRSAAAPHALVAGGGGALGSAVLEALLAQRRFAAVRVLVTRALSTAMHGLEPVVVDSLVDDDDDDDDDATVPAPIADAALIVFDRPRHANGRELAFVRPAPAELPQLARWLRRRGVRSLVVVLPHAPASLPDALKHGLANLDEQAVAALGFEHLVFVRSAQAPAHARAARWLERLALGLLAQLRIMVASSHQPVRGRKVAQFVAELAVRLPTSRSGTRIVPPELVWHAAQLRDPAALVQAWLEGAELPAVKTPPMRL